MSADSSAAPTPAAAPPAAPPAKSRVRAAAIAVVAIVIVIVVVLAGLYYAKIGPFASSSSVALEEGGFTLGQVVTFTYNGTNTYLCTPGMSTMFPGNSTATAAAGTTMCEVGNAQQNAIFQVPEWVLVPAFAGLSVFGVSALGASSDGFPTMNGTTVLTDCGAGGTKAACVDHPTYLYSPLFVAVEQSIGKPGGYGGLPPGVLPTPAHDHVINTSTDYPNVQWGTIAVLVLDPNILPDRASGACTATVHSNLSNPIGNCLTSLAALDRAATTCSSSVVAYNTATANPIWKTLNGLAKGTVCDQVVVPGDLTIPQINANLNGNLYIPFKVTPGAPSSFPS
ncbi:MAG TPA: hypothetical protein VGV89_01030 [Thermoplasmata archaeon]|nr:hypothetical protein [Thermoplasmata archaeon]